MGRETKKQFLSMFWYVDLYTYRSASDCFVTDSEKVTENERITIWVRLVCIHSRLITCVTPSRVFAIVLLDTYD